MNDAAISNNVYPIPFCMRHELRDASAIKTTSKFSKVGYRLDSGPISGSKKTWLKTGNKMIC